jgi:hypothetical protein
VDTHTLGYGDDHDPLLCKALTEMNTNEGTFMFIQSEDQVMPAINSIAGSLGDKVIKA